MENYYIISFIPEDTTVTKSSTTTNADNYEIREDHIKKESKTVEDSTVSTPEKISDKRKDYISWAEYFMQIAVITAQRSKDPVTQVGAVIVNNNRIVSTGYNGFPNGINDDVYPWGKNKEQPLMDKRTFVVHAELNAILNANDFDKLKGSTLYVTEFPCNECAKALIQAGIKKVIYLSDSDEIYKDYRCIAANVMFNAVGIEVIWYNDLINK